MSELKNRAVQMFSQGEFFRAIAYGALKARAGRLASGEVIVIGEFEMMVVEDENGEGNSVQIIETLERMEAMALAKARSLDRKSDGWSDHERRAWLDAFWSDLARYLDRWQNIKMRFGPGENITFEKAVSR